MESGEQEWIEAPDGWGEEGNQEDDQDGPIDIFSTDDSHYTFTCHVKLNDTSTKTVKLHGFKLDSDETDHSTGVTLWQAAPRLAKYLEENVVVSKDKLVLELGAGLGLCGIAAHYLGAKSVIMTDGDTHTLQGMRENVRQNCDDDTKNSISCRQLIWGSPHMEKFLQEHGKFDTILGADVIYTIASIEPLFDTVAFLLNEPHGQFVLSRYSKWHNVENSVIIEVAKARGLDCIQPTEGILIFHRNKT